MPLTPRLFPGDEELKKKDDDHNLRARGYTGLPWRPRKIFYGQRRHVKRAMLGIFVFWSLYYFFKNMPTDLENPRHRPSYGSSAVQLPTTSRPKASPIPSHHKANTKPKGSEKEVKSPYDFSGPIFFYDLSTSLRDASMSQMYEVVNRNVLFAAASLKSASILLPIACEMGLRKKNFVSFALMGRDDISIDLLRSMNGIDDDCNIIFHDARPDNSVRSTEYRMEVSVAAAYGHLKRYLGPQATLIDGSGEEERFLLTGLKGDAKSLSNSVIQVPKGAEKSLMWLTWLNAASLSAWNDVTIDIVIHAPKSSSGSLMRLLDSLRKADYFATTPPRLTIELPHVIAEPTKRYLQNFKWPPQTTHNAGSTLTLHHRIPQSALTPEDNDIRFLESFWPAGPSRSHILVLSPQMELSPLFYHYLKYSMLHYKYSSSSEASYGNALGISLEIPGIYLNDSAGSSPPQAVAASAGNGTESKITPFLWQAPSSSAALYFGDKWVELHDFVTHLLSSRHMNPSSIAHQAKLISKNHPSWLEHILKLARARGYFMIYPGFEAGASIANLHTDLYQRPEEYPAKQKKVPLNDDVLTADPTLYKSLRDKNMPPTTGSLLNVLPFGGELPNLSQMPLLSWDGAIVGFEALGRHAATYSNVLRQEVGHCTASSKEKARVDMAAGDLFCLEDGKK